MAMLDNGSQPRAKKAPRSDREWLDASGAPILEDDDYHTARGGAYTFKATGKTVERVFSTDNLPELFMYATFGFLTLMGNVANAKSPEQGYDDCLTRADLIKGGKWVERTGVGGPRYNAENLAKAISFVKHGSYGQAGTYAAKIGPDKPKITVRNAQGANVEMDYGAFAYTNPAVRAHHDSLQGRVAADADAL